MKGVKANVKRGVGVSNDLVRELCTSICSSRFKGVYSADLIPTSRLLDSDDDGDFVIVVNLATSDRPLGHFVTIGVNSKQVDYMDPYGLPYTYQKDVTRFIKRCKRTVMDRRQKVQSLNSVFCGLYATLFAAYWDRRPEFPLDFSSEDYDSNDEKCVRYLKKIVNHST